MIDMTPEQVIGLPVDQLGLLILNDLIATNEWNVFVTFNHYIPGTVPPLAGSFVVSGFPSPSTAGVAGSFTVTAEDANGHVATGYTGTLHFTSSDAQAVLPANYTFVAADAGVHAFNATPV